MLYLTTSDCWLMGQFKSVNISSSVLSLLNGPTLTSIHDHWKNHSFDYMDLCQRGNFSAFLYTKFAIAFLSRNMCLLISWLQSPSAVILETKKIKSDTVSTVSPSISRAIELNK